MILTNNTANETAENDDTVLLRQTTASIADALLRLGGSDDSGESSSSSQMESKRKRLVSVIAESDAASTSSQSTATENNVKKIHQEPKNKRQRKSPIPPSQVVCSVPNEACSRDSSKPTLNIVREGTNTKAVDEKDEERALSFSTSEFQREVQIQPSQRKFPGDIGCISQMFHKDFRPLRAAPRMPSQIVPDYPPPMPAMPSRFVPSANPGTMYSTAITEHNDCLIMHSYTVLPRMMNPHQLALAQLTNGM